ncbi:hypothetical protein CONPUDRAFT_160778 [Coniophora puteana RWD-64-598 SS2]|uniref:Uncharacterized protein n=1 Tax=Coniophora puteana (strain RWD-64-598) TaxID=741705 RepID=R7SC36_CONPW|nr:uncharacterized protein CONPUDRAFT_160778 [Coniophora puteana RWD-64-598 SS2]EIW73731.1 hypothetical protein CONPUDRAFT_160778 [Coniophora puteana RWD-64-598 SS2]
MSGQQMGQTPEDAGGCKEQIEKLHEMVETPLLSPERFVKLGIDPLKGVLLFGPPIGHMQRPSAAHPIFCRHSRPGVGLRRGTGVQQYPYLPRSMPLSL